MRPADSDGASYRTTQRRRQADIDFLTAVRIASLDELRIIERDHASKKAPRWKKVAIERAIKRVSLTTSTATESQRKT